MNQRRGLTIFDVDGPLRSASIIAWPEFLFKKGLLPKKAVELSRKDFQEYKSKKTSFSTFARNLTDHVAQGLKGKSVKAVRTATEKFVKIQVSRELHPYTRELVERMNQRGPTIAITGQPQEFADALMKILPFYMAIGTQYEVKNGKYTGKTKRYLSLEKEAIVRELKRHPNIWKFKPPGTERKTRWFAPDRRERNRESVSFGDMVTDARFMRHTKKPIALNPDKKMENLARKKGWPIVHGKQVLRRIRRLK